MFLFKEHGHSRGALRLEREHHVLLELAIGDVYGAGFEYADTEMIRQHNNLSCYVKHPRHNIQPGSYTDDTQMSLAIAETIRANPGSRQCWHTSLSKHFSAIPGKDTQLVSTTFYCMCAMVSSFSETSTQQAIRV